MATDRGLVGKAIDANHGGRPLSITMIAKAARLPASRATKALRVMVERGEIELTVDGKYRRLGSRKRR